MSQLYPVSKFQILTLMGASVIVGAFLTLAALRVAPSPAGAAVTTPGAAGANPQLASPEVKRGGSPVVHFEIGCRDIAKTSDFYGKLFDWQINKAGPAATISTGSKTGIQGHITALGHDPQNYVTFYIEVDDLDAYLKKANELGGKTVVPPIKIPTGQFAWMADPDGNIVGLIHSKKP